jgi:HAE1 family hydrophobic/amphiphilic exporter-1
VSFRLSAWAIRNPIPVVVTTIALVIVGLACFSVLPVKRFPNVEFPVVSVSVVQTGAAPTEMETQITRPIEDALTGISGLRHITSNVSLGSSTTVVQFEIGVDLQRAVDDVRSAVERTRNVLPAGIEPPSVSRLDQSDQPILTYAVSAPGMTDVELSWFVDDTVTRAVQIVSGVSQVRRVGGVEREINVTLDPDRLAANGVTAAAISNALAGYNRDDTGGRADVGEREQTVRVLGSAATVGELRQLTIPLASGRYIRLDDVATVSDGIAEQRGFARLDGRPAVAFQVTRTSAASEVSVEDGVRRAIDQLLAANPGVAITPIVSIVTESRNSYDATMEVLLEGMVLAALVVWLFLRDWRSTLIAAAAMPLSLIPTFAAMFWFGFSLNLITLLALTLVIGILVDDAIVEIENIEKRIQRGATPYRAALVGADAIGLAVIATTASIMVVFLPVSFMGSQAGQFFKEFGVTVAVAVLFSLAIARFVTPLMAAYFLRPARKPHARPPLNPAYARVLDWALGHKWWSAVIGALCFFGALGIATTIPADLQPVDDNGYLYLNVQGPQGATLKDMEEAIAHVTRELQKRPDVERVFAQVGSTVASGGPPGVGGGAGLSSGTITVILKKDRSMSTAAFKLSITGLLRTIPDVRITNQASFGAAGVEVILAGDDSVALEKAQLALLQQMRTLPSVLEPRPTPPPAAPELIIRPRAAEAARLNISSAAIAQAIRIATIGDIDANVAKFSAGTQRLPIRVRLPSTARANLSDIANLQIPALNGKTTPLSSVADLTFQAGPGQITRYDRERRVSVQGDLNNVTLGTALADIARLPIMQNLPPGVREAKAGVAEIMGELFGGIGIAMAAGISLIFSVLVLLFRSFFKPATILSALPLTMIGAFLALKLSGLPLTMPVLIGMLMLFGLAAKNSILLVEFAIEEERAGVARRTAIINACHERARPIVMTTAAMAAGMLPTALGFGEGAEFRQPMAIAVIGGLLSSTALSLVLVPAVYEIIDGFEEWLVPKLSWILTPKQPGDDAPITAEEDANAHRHRED